MSQNIESVALQRRLDDIGINIADVQVPDAPWGDAVRVRIATIQPLPTDRRQRRLAQSLGARVLLARTLGMVEPRSAHDKWTLARAPNGQLKLLGSRAPSVCISHSGDWVGCATATRVAVGIDIEVIKSRPWDAYEEFFHPAEFEWIVSAQGGDRDVRGLACWCRREAVAKALGTGLSFSLTKIDFSHDKTGFVLSEQFGEATGWTIVTTVLINAVVIAVAWHETR